MRKICLILLAIFNILPIFAKSDTILVHKRIPHSVNEVEYYLRSGKNVSSFSTIIRTNKKEVSHINIISRNDIKYSLIDSNTPISDKMLSDSHVFRMSYNQQMDALKDILNDLNKRYSFNNKIVLNFQLHVWGDEALNISNSYKRNRQNEWDESTFRKIIMQSQLIKDIKNLLAEHSLTISDISFEEMSRTSLEYIQSISKINQNDAGDIYSIITWIECSPNNFSTNKNRSK